MPWQDSMKPSEYHTVLLLVLPVTQTSTGAGEGVHSSVNKPLQNQAADEVFRKQTTLAPDIVSRLCPGGFQQSQEPISPGFREPISVYTIGVHGVAGADSGAKARTVVAQRLRRRRPLPFVQLQLRAQALDDATPTCR